MNVSTSSPDVFVAQHFSVFRGLNKKIQEGETLFIYGEIL